MELSRLTKLTFLDLSNANLKLESTDLKTLIGSLANLRELYLDGVNISLKGSGWCSTLSSSLPRLRMLSMKYCGLSDLEYLNLEDNSISGTLPIVVFSVPSSQVLQLQNNHFTGEVHEFANAFSSFLHTLDLGNNHLNGSIPRSIFELECLSELILTSNFEVIKGLPRLTILDLSCNNLRIEIQGSNSTSFPFPQMSELRLASCQLQKFLDLKNQSSMNVLDLSDNNITGEVPCWIWSIALSYLNLSCNFLDSLEEPYYISTDYWMVIDLHTNRIKGDVPILPTSLTYFSVANNKFTGSIPSSICNLDQLQFLDMSNNAINSKLPPCLFQMCDYLLVLNLGRYRLSGIILDTFSLNCSLITLDLSSNTLEGRFPRSLERCASLEVLDIGSNKIRDTFPCMLKKLPKKRYQYLQVEFNGYGMYYRNRVTLTLKGREMEIVNNFEAFTSMDFSCNNFKGEIPEVLGDLKPLYLLNLSHNALTGRIPNALGKLTQLGSLDLSVNQLSGRIPDKLAGLTFLYFLNLSFNQLSGRIPSGKQLQTFSTDSFEGNTGLYNDLVDRLLYRILG
ncbi:hypothetical protein RND71_023413 [Anisodus tanguticus]|uniref:Uncharacterized protein n=1 Tax=Anisodus tanguticus TaxID=243964 RepID=A0AAE1V618_9SOLA|nr:hypothetical protein RND71_023413 [Anisodus tanguticus]